MGRTTGTGLPPTESSSYRPATSVGVIGAWNSAEQPSTKRAPIAFEEGTQAQWLPDLLVPLVQQVVVCDRHGEKRRGTKGDRVDADQLSARLWRGEGLPRESAPGHPPGAPPHLPEPGRGHHPSHAPAQGPLSSAGHPDAGTRVYQPMHCAHWLGQLPDRGVRFRAETLYTELDIYRARRPPGPPALSEDGPPGGSPGRSRVVRVVDHSVSGLGSCRIAARHAPDTMAIPDQATPLGLCRPRGDHRDQRRARAPARSASATPAARASASATARRGMQCAMNLSGRPATAVSVALQS